MTFWGGSGSADPCLWLMDPDPGSCYFRHWPSRCKQKTIFLTHFSAYYFLKLHLNHFSKIKSQKESQNSRNQGFSYYFCMMIEGSGSGRPKNMWIRIRIRNTGLNYLRSVIRLLITEGGPGSGSSSWADQYIMQASSKLIKKHHLKLFLAKFFVIFRISHTADWISYQMNGGLWSQSVLFNLANRQLPIIVL
jgi:hypothetical protein